MDVSLHELWEFIERIYEYSELFKKIVEWLGFPLIIAAIAIGATQLFRGWSFLARFHYDGGVLGYVRALDRFWVTFWADPGGAHSTDAARLLTEFEILYPPARRPLRHELNRSLKSRWCEWRVWRAELESWHRSVRKWKQERRQTLGKLIEKKRQSRGKIDSMTHDQWVNSLPTIVLDNPARIDEHRDQIQRYFTIGQKFHAFEFESYVRLNDGFFAPLFLINGLMTRFNSQWDPVINNYRPQLRGQINVSQELLELQSFEFNCWLLWGPSVSLCSCEQWQSEHGKHVAGEDTILYQYGFGDENNSLDVKVLNGRADSFTKLIKEKLIQPGEDPKSGLPPNVHAAPQALVGRIGWRLSNDNLCMAQRIIGDKKHGRIFLYHTHLAGAAEPSSYYYSAYIWLMFMVGDENGNPLHPERWKNLLPFFEHGNIADATTLATLKECLVAKTCSALREIFQRKADEGRITIRYACALDDSNCGHELLFPSRQAAILNLLKDAVGRDAILKQAQDQKRLLLPAHSEKGNPFSSCLLPGIVADFYQAIENEEKKRCSAISCPIPASKNAAE